jgi:hypothetical protein
MRFVAVMLICAGLLGSVAWCQFMLTREVRVDITREANGHAEHAPAESAGGVFRLELTPTFNAADDPFAVRTDPSQATSRLRVSRGDTVVLDHTRDLRRHESIVAGDLAFTGQEVELFVRATPAADEAAHSCAVRLRLFNSQGALCDDVTLWSQGGGRAVAGTVTLRLEPRLESLDRGLGERE